MEMGFGVRVVGFGVSGRSDSRARVLGSIPLAAALLLAPGLARAAIINVTTTQQQVNTDGDCSLQEAIFAANFDASVAIDPANPANFIDTACTPGDLGPDTIVLAPGAIYPMSGIVVDPFNPAGAAANPSVIGSLVIEGNGARLERVGGLDFRAFVVAPPGAQVDGPQAPEGVFSELTIRDLHIRGFRARGGDGAGGGGGGMGAGGAIFAYFADLNLERCTFEDNAATGGNGGADDPSPSAAGGGGGGLSASANGGAPGLAGGGGGGAIGAGGAGSANAGGGGGGTLTNGFPGGAATGGPGGFLCGGPGGDFIAGSGFNSLCQGGGAGGGAANDDGPAGGGGFGFWGGGAGGGGASAFSDTGFGFGGDGGFAIFGGGGGAGGSGPDAPGYGGFGGFGGGGGGAGIAFGAGAQSPSGDQDGFGGPFGGNAGAGHGGGGAGLGGAIFVGEGQLQILNSTFHGNGAFGGLAGGPGAEDGEGAGGAIFLYGGYFSMNHGTVSGSSGAGSIYYFGDVFFPAAPEGFDLEFDLYNSIVADHTDPMQPNCIVECEDCSVFEFGVNNLDDSNVGNDCVGTTQTGDPQLDPLAIYPPGVPTMTPLTPTRRLQLTSPAIDNADADYCLEFDQRGVPRPQLLGCDIGAYERDTYPTTTTLVCVPNPSLYTQLVTCTATVASSGGGTPAGSVDFAIDAGPSLNVALDGAGQASFSTSTLTVGVHQVDADYLGSPVHDPSSAAPFFQTVNPIPTTTALVCAPNPSIYTQLVTCTATVTATFGALVPTGTLTFAVDAVPMAPVALDGAGQASFSTSSLTVGLHTVDAAYNGATEFVPSVAPTWNQTVQPIPTATSVVCAPDPSFYAQEVVCTATVVSTFGALVPVGDVAIGFDGAPAPTQPLDGAGQASRAVSDLEVGEHAVVASYVGSTNFAPSTSPQFDQTVVKIPTGTTLDVAPNPALVGSTVGFTAMVVKTEPYDGLPTGDVVFSIDGVDEPPVPIDGAGVAILFKAANDIGPGEHVIGARYLGEPHFEESAAADVVLRIVTIQEIPTLDASGLAALILLLAAGALTILVRRRTGHRR